MVRIRQLWLVAVIGIALVASCKKDPATSDPTGKAEKGEPGKPSNDDLSLLPVDSEIVLGINTAQLQQSSLWKQFVEPKMMTGDTLKSMTAFKEKCGFDPAAAVKTVSVGMKIVNNKPDGVVVIHGLDKAKSWACVDKMKDEMTAQGVEITRDGDAALIKGKNGEVTAVTFIDDSTAIGVFGANATVAGVKAAAAGGSVLKTSPAFVEMYKKVTAGDSLWFLAHGKVLDGLGPFVKAKSAFGSFNVTDGLAADVHMKLESPDAATQFANLVKGQAKQAATMVDKFDVTNDSDEVRMVIVLSNQKLQALIAQLGGMMGALGGMGGN